MGYVVVVVVMDDEWRTLGRVVDILIFAYDWYGWYLMCGIEGPSISLMMEYGRVGE